VAGSVYTELVSTAEQLPRVLRIAMRTAVSRRGVAVLVVPGDVLIETAARGQPVSSVRRTVTVSRPADDELAAAAALLNASERVTILAGAGCAGAHAELLEAARVLQAPIVHTLRGKEHVEYDNPFDVGITGLLGFASGYRAMESCDALPASAGYRPTLPRSAGWLGSTRPSSPARSLPQVTA
jgi:pyruvate dehydrogenase (quinone)